MRQLKVGDRIETVSPVFTKKGSRIVHGIVMVDGKEGFNWKDAPDWALEAPNPYVYTIKTDDGETIELNGSYLYEEGYRYESLLTVLLNLFRGGYNYCFIRRWKSVFDKRFRETYIIYNSQKLEPKMG